MSETTVATEPQEIKEMDRLNAVKKLRDEGKTQREIAAQLGVHQSTVSHALDALAEREREEAERAQASAPKVKGSDGKEYPARKAKVIDNPEPGEDSGSSPELTGRPAKLGVGVARAAEAINVLKRIPPNDPLRCEGYKMVANFVKNNL